MVRQDEAMEDLRAAIQAAIRRDQSERLQVTNSYGCLPFEPSRDYHRKSPGGPLFRTVGGLPAKGPCPICSRPLKSLAPPAFSLEPKFLICGACERGSPRIERQVRVQIHVDLQRQHLIQHNRALTAGTPTPPILLAFPAEGDPALAQPECKRRRKPRSLVERYGLEIA